MAKSGTTFKDCIGSYQPLSGSVAGGVASGTYLLMGPESYFIDMLSDRFAENLLDESEKAFNLLLMYGKDTDCGQLINICRQMPMMGTRQVVIVKEAQQLRKPEQLTVYAQNPNPSTVLVLCHKEKNMDKRSQLYKAIAKTGTVFESVQPRDYEIGGWLAQTVASKGLRMEPKALNMMVDHLGTDLSKISNELDKLFVYLPQETQTVTAADIENIIGISKDFNNYELTKAISEGNSGKALLIAEHFARNPKDNPLVVTISTLFVHFQRIFILNYQRWFSKAKGQPMPQDAELSRMLKLPSPFFLNEFKQAAGLYPNRNVFRILGLIREYDLKSKGMNSGSADHGELLRELLLNIFLVK